jgi:Transposase DDE domain group 1
VNAKIREQLRARKQRIEKRLDKTKFCGDCPMMSAASIQYEVAERTQAIAAGGIGLIHQLVKSVELDRLINRYVRLFKLYLPYSESDHVLNIAYNLLAGGTCLEHLELRRQDEAYLNALGAQRIPDPTTAGDFCRRFSPFSIHLLMEVFNSVRIKVWRQQPADFFEEAILDADGTIVETTGECKEGIDINHEGKWGYHPLIISLANTQEPLYLINRSGNRPSHEQAHVWLDQAVALCRRVGFRKIRLRGDTDFTQTEQLDRWDDEGVTFVFGIDAMPNLYEIVEKLPEKAWKPLRRSPRWEVKTSPRARPENVKQEVVEKREFKDVRLVKEYVAEFSYRPGKCQRAYRVVVVWKDLEVKQGQTKLFDDSKCFFYITNDWESSAEAIVRHANRRCNQENLIEQQKNGVRALTAPLDNLTSNWAYMVIASLAWSLKAWAALLVPVDPRRREAHVAEKRTLLRMDFTTFRQAMINLPAQILRSGRRLIYRLLAWNRWQTTFFRLWSQLQMPLRC